MRRLSRGIALAAAALLVGVAGVSRAEAQTVSVQDAQAFMGAWALAIDAQGQQMAMDLNVTDNGGNVAAEFGSEMGTQAVSKVAKDGEKLVLTFEVDAQGQMLPIVITLTPTDAGLDASMDVAGGMFVATGKGTKK